MEHMLIIPQIDYTASIILITHVNSTLDALPSAFNLKKLNGVVKGASKHYNVDK